jgi:hypothetical protein
MLEIHPTIPYYYSESPSFARVEGNRRLLVSQRQFQARKYIFGSGCSRHGWLDAGGDCRSFAAPQTTSTSCMTRWASAHAVLCAFQPERWHSPSRIEPPISAHARFLLRVPCGLPVARARHSELVLFIGPFGRGPVHSSSRSCRTRQRSAQCVDDLLAGHRMQPAEGHAALLSQSKRDLRSVYHNCEEAEAARSRDGRNQHRPSCQGAREHEPDMTTQSNNCPPRVAPHRSSTDVADLLAAQCGASK